MTDLRWYGWGTADKTYLLDHRPDAWRFLRAALELRGDEAFPACDLDSIRLRAPRLNSAQLNALRHIAPETKTDPRSRVLRAYGRSYRDLIRLRRGEIPHPPDAVVYPANEDAVARVLAFCAQNDFALIPFGGGSSVVGGVEPRDGRVTITLDLARLNRVISIDEISQTATMEAGILGPDLERELNARGFTLGHFPQSFEFSTLGGWIATRDAGIEARTQSLRVATPRGFVEAHDVSNPALLQLFIGSEGAFGVITRATMRIRRLPKTKDYRALLFKSFSDGIAALRAISQDNVVPTIARLLDEDATRAFHAFALREESRGWKALLEQLGLDFLFARNHSFEQGALMILGFEDDAAGARAGQAICKSRGAFDLGRGVADAWLRDRYETPYLRDVLLDHGILVDTLETATTWSNLEQLHKTLTATIADVAAQTGARVLVMTHVSHCYRDGASLCVTFLARMARGKEIEQWEAIKRAATDCIVANGGALSHHHGVGYEHAAWMNRENGAVGMDALRAVKNALDPKNVMNPDKWLGAEPSSVDAAIEYQERFWNLPR
ncbi:MAG: FAD-binding oxidoreductase [Chloroflexota bacterium]